MHFSAEHLLSALISVICQFGFQYESGRFSSWETVGIMSSKLAIRHAVRFYGEDQSIVQHWRFDDSICKASAHLRFSDVYI